MPLIDGPVLIIEDEGLRCVESVLTTLEDHKGLLVLASHQIGSYEGTLDDVIVLYRQRNDARRVDVIDPDVSTGHATVVHERRIVQSDVRAHSSGSAQTLQLLAVHHIEAVIVQDLLNAVELVLALACIDLHDLAQVRIISAAPLREVQLVELDLLAVEVLPSVEVCLLVRVPLITLFDDVLGVVVIFEAELLELLDRRCDFCLVVHQGPPISLSRYTRRSLKSSSSPRHTSR